MIANVDVLKFYENMSKHANYDQNCVKLKHNTDYTIIDAEFILKHANEDTDILDIGTGTGLIVNKMYNRVKSIECIEPFEEFTKYVTKAPGISIVNTNIFDYNTDKKFGMITIFGTMHHFNKKEAEKIYSICYDLFRKNGKLIVKNQFGIKEDVVVSGYSEEQKTDYYASYRYIQDEIKTLANIGFENIQIFDIYPPEANRWDNTRFYAIVAEKN